MPILIFVLACTANLQGLVDKRPLGTWIQTSEGAEYQLVLGEGSAAVAHLDGLIVEVEGRRVFRKVDVEDWRCREGSHGLTAWVGVIEERGVQLGLRDRNSDGWYFLDADSVDTLRPFLGKPVLIEGYVVGAHEVAAVYYRPLF